MCTPDRRRFLQGAAVLAGAATLPMPMPGLGRFARAATGDDPHFFLLAAIPGGMDATYLFDARPLAMTKASIVANYLNEEPTPWAGVNGQTTLATKLAAPLLPFKDRFSVLNGVLMAASFDGHPQNLNYLFTGNPFGGESFVPHLNAAASPSLPMDYVQTGSLFADITNGGSSMPLTAASARALVARLKASAEVSPSDKVYGFIQSRIKANAAGPGRFSAAARLMDSAAVQAPGLSASLRGLTLPDAGTDELIADVQIATQFFKAKITPCAVLTLTPMVDGAESTPDTHAGLQAKDSGKIVGDIAAQLAKIFATLKATPYDDKRSMLDVTTVVAATEFSRTMRQTGMAMDQTGTDHNPLNNSVLIGGKGIKGGMVVGESDHRTEGEELSGAHMALDQPQLKAMGRPFDFKALAPRGDLPAEYAVKDYLTFASVANTIYTMFDADPKRHWQLDAESGPAPVLSGILA